MTFTQKQFVPAGSLAQRFGVKMIAYGPPGEGKTPLMTTATNACALIVEQGAGSLQGATFPAYNAGLDATKIRDWMTWLATSAEARNFDMVMIDSISKMAEVLLAAWQKKNKDGRAAYGDMAREMLSYGNGLHELQNKHVYLIAQEGYFDEGGVRKRRPNFPGKELHSSFPHTYDCLIHVGLHNIPAVGNVKSLQCAPTFDTMARDRFGKFDLYEPPNLTALINKAMTPTR